MKLKSTPRINLLVKESFTFNGKYYDVGHKFHVIGECPMRGWDIEDDFGNKIYETAFIHHKFEQVD